MKQLKCIICGTELKGAFYNPPAGAHCAECWEKKPQEERDKALMQALLNRTRLY